MIDAVVKILEAIAHLVGAFAWPLVALAALRWFAPTIRSMFSDKSDVSLSGFGAALTAKRESREAIAIAEATKVESVGATPQQINWFQNSVGKSFSATRWISSLRLDDTIGKSILWADDQPENNTYERRALEKLGIDIDTVPSTAAAIEALKGREYDVIISDMSRPESPRAGRELLEKLTILRPATPFIVYTSSISPEQEVEIIKAGAFGSTNSASELIRLITDALKSHSKSSRGEPMYLQAIRDLASHRITKGERIFD
ncbi:MAG: response regulator [Pseudomonadota bacterium]